MIRGVAESECVSSALRCVVLGRVGSGEVVICGVE